jgi:hypothetical protein
VFSWFGGRAGRPTPRERRTQPGANGEPKQPPAEVADEQLADEAAIRLARLEQQREHPQT